MKRDAIIVLAFLHQIDFLVRKKAYQNGKIIQRHHLFGSAAHDGNVIAIETEEKKTKYTCRANLVKRRCRGDYANLVTLQL